MNERLMRAAPQYFAEFITAFEDGEQRSMPQRGPVRRPAASIFLLKRALDPQSITLHGLDEVQHTQHAVPTEHAGQVLCTWCSHSWGGGGAQSCWNVQEPLWLVWRYEGDYTLYDLMQKKDWPYNLEPLLFGRELNIPKGPERRWLSLRIVVKQAGH